MRELAMTKFANRFVDSLVKAGKKNWLIRLVVFAALVSPFILVASFSYIKTNRDLTNFTLARRESLASLAALVLEEKFDRLVDIGVSFATRVQFRKLVSDGKWQEAMQILQSVPIDFLFIDRVLLADPEGTLIADKPSLPGVRGRNFALRDWYQGVSRTWRPYISEVYKRAAEPYYNVLAVAIPVKSEELKIVGILVLQVRLETLLMWSTTIEGEASDLVSFVDTKGHIASHPKFPPQGDIVDFSSLSVVQKVLQGQGGVERLFNPIENEEVLVAYAPVGKYGWGALAQQSTATAFAA